MGGSGERGPRPHRDPIGPAPSPPPMPHDSGPGDEGSGSGRGNSPCPTDFPAEVTDIPQDMQARAAQVPRGVTLPIVLQDGDPAFILDGEIFGWLATNIDEVTACLTAGWTYHATVQRNTNGPAGAVIETLAIGTPPTT
jgi:hypothetical protein